MVAEEYENASMKDQDEMLENMKFAIGKIGEIAKKVQELINFVNPYCESEVNESMTTGKPKFKKGDFVRLVGNSPVGRGMNGMIVDIELDYPDWGYTVNGRSGLFFADEEDLELVKSQYYEEYEYPRIKVGDKIRSLLAGDNGRVGVVKSIGYGDCEVEFEDGEVNYVPIEEVEKLEFTEEEDNSKMKNEKYEKFGGDPDMLPIEEIVGVPISADESGETLSAEEFVDAMQDLNNEVFEVYDGGVKEGVAYLNVLVHQESVSYAEVESCFNDATLEYGWKLYSFGYSDDMVDSIVDDGNCAIVVQFKPANANVNESDLENELNKGDDGWKEVGQPVGEAKVTVDANDVWEVLDLLSDEQANKNLTDLINSHVRTEDEIMDAIESIASSYGSQITKDSLNGMFAPENISELIDALGLDVDAYMDKGQIVDSNKPTSVELEGTDWKDLTEKLDAYELVDSIDGWGLEYNSSDFGVSDASRIGDEKVIVLLTTKSGSTDEIQRMVEKYLLYNVSNWKVDSVEKPNKSEDGTFFTAVNLVPDYDDEVTLEDGEDGVNDEQKPEEIKNKDKTFTQDGETKSLVTGEENSGKSTFSEMTIEQEVNDPWKLLELLWGQGKENLDELLRSNLFSDDTIMATLEEFDVRDLTNLNDLLAFDFEHVLEALGCDVDAWTQNLEIKKL